MRLLVIAMLALASQGAPPTASVSTLVGRWVTTVVPEAGTAPMVPPSFTIVMKDAKVFVAFERAPEPLEAITFETRVSSADQAVPLLLIRYPATSTTTRMVMLRPIAPGQLRYEIYVESAGGQTQRNWSYTEVFQKSK